LPIFQQLVHQITEEIRRGRLLPGSALPGSREFAHELGVNRKTVVTAYDELVAQGWLTSNSAQGTFVSAVLPNMPPHKQACSQVASPSRTIAPDYSVFDELGDIPMVSSLGYATSFDDGLPDTRLIPAQLLGRAYRSALLLATRTNRLLYDDPRGNLQLRQSISTMLNAERGLSASVENICLTRGSQMGIYAAARALIRPGTTVALGELTYPPANFVFRNLGAQVVPIRMTRTGFDIDHFEQICRQREVSAVYLTPHHQFPTTVIMPPEHRMRMLSMAEQFHFSIIEDDYDHEFNFDFKPLLPMASFAPSKVVYVGSFSKLLAPSLRVGYVVACKSAIDAIAKQILLIDRQGDSVTEMAISEIMQSGELNRHAHRALNVYRNRRDVFASLLRANFGDLVTFTLPPGGLAFWVTFPNEGSLARLEERAKSSSINFLPSDSFAIGAHAPKGLRFGFASKNEREMSESITALRGLLN
jgi:GntR family transcriptional regulator/MocR family aminotransferase